MHICKNKVAAPPGARLIRKPNIIRELPSRKCSRRICYDRYVKVLEKVTKPLG